MSSMKKNMPASRTDRTMGLCGALVFAALCVSLTGCPEEKHPAAAAQPAASGNPVFSVRQTEIAIAGTDLDDYLEHELQQTPRRRGANARGRPIRFWSDMLG